jgi:hypothetical protein
MRGHSVRNPKTQASVRLYTAVDTANLKGLSHAGAPVMMRGSAKTPMSEGMATTSITSPTAVSGGLECHSCLTKLARRVSLVDWNVSLVAEYMVDSTKSFEPRAVGQKLGCKLRL